MIDISYDSLNSLFGTCIYPGTQYYRVFNHHFSNLSVTVKNFGTQPIHKVGIYTYKGDVCSASCSIPKALEWSFDINLQSGQDTVLNLGDVTLELQDATQSAKVFIWTGAPNNKIDINSSNDSLSIFVTPVNIFEPNQIKELTIFPNPTNDILNITTNINENLRVQIINAAGQFIIDDMVISLQNQSVDVSNLPSGFYVLKGMTDSGQSYIGKFIKH